MSSRGPDTSVSDGRTDTDGAGRNNSQTPEIGEKVHGDLKTRSAQQNGKSENCVEANLTEFGKDYHGIEPGDLLQVDVCEEGIFIQPFDP